MDRWGFYIDVEGFSAIYRNDKARAICVLNELMEALYKVGSTVFSESPDRLFIHQFGDGFVVVSDFPEKTAERPLAICMAIMRHLIARGVATKAGISAGDFADIFSCYPPAIQEAAEDHRYVRLGEGLMTIIPVMGSALTNSYRLLSRCHGAVLLLDATAFCELPAGVMARGTSPTVIDWIHSDFPLVRKICDTSGLKYIDPTAAETQIRSYLRDHSHELSKDWVSFTTDSLGMARHGR
jgi:hypothetical protein